MLLTVDPLVTLISSPYFGQCQNEFIRYDHKADLLSGHVTSCPYGSHEDLTPWEYLAKH
jgi:hypothetical protein